MGKWGADPWLIAQLLDDAAFGPGAIGWPDNNHRIGAGVGILVDDGYDPQLAAVFHHRRRIRDDRKFIATFTASPARVWSILSPDAPEALIGVQAEIIKPRNVRRTFLLLASKHATILEPLTRAGATLWLVPHQIAMRHWAKEGTGTACELWRRCLPLGQTTAPMQGIQLALAHIRRPATTP